MHLILFNHIEGSGGQWLRFALNRETLASRLIETAYQGYVHRTRCTRYYIENVPLVGAEAKPYWCVPESWGSQQTQTVPRLSYGKEGLPTQALPRSSSSDDWIVLSDGRYANQLNKDLLQTALDRTDADVVAVHARPDLVGYRERMLVTEDHRLAGMRRFYEDSIEYQPFSRCQPHHLLIRSQVFMKLIQGLTHLPTDLATWVEKVQALSLDSLALGVAGNVLDLTTEAGLLSHWVQQADLVPSEIEDWQCRTAAGMTTQTDIRVAGRAWVHKEAVIEPEVILVGPCLICAGARLERGAVVDRSMIGPGVVVSSGRILTSRVALENGDLDAEPASPIQEKSPVYDHPFKTWRSMSYASCFKRIVDVVVASLVLLLFFPLFPLIGLAIKLNSPGSIFYGARRQGLHGKVFHCLKFRSMKPGADKLQEQLRAINEVDGPQFKMADDPRISAVGRFLRETYLDEIPQFINVLRGEMSIVGPRPSPKVENTQCPAWRDARLSVRPGVTGLWQVKRTRDPVKDFQEWIQYDIEYVRHLSLKMDLWICWATFKSMLGKFAEQF